MNARIANGPMQLIPNGTVAMRTVTASSSSINLINTTALNASTRHIFWTLTGGNARFTIDGSTPNATTGHQIQVGSSGCWSAVWANAVKVIREGGTDAVFTISELNHT